MCAKILLVDDETAIRESLGRKLRREGFVVELADNGVSGLRAFHADRPDLVVLDIVMPEMDGFTVCQRIREVADTPIMMLSAQAIDEARKVPVGQEKTILFNLSGHGYLDLLGYEEYLSNNLTDQVAERQRIKSSLKQILPV